MVKRAFVLGKKKPKKRTSSTALPSLSWPPASLKSSPGKKMSTTATINNKLVRVVHGVSPGDEDTPNILYHSVTIYRSSAKEKEGEKVGKATGCLILRDEMRRDGSFGLEMSEESAELEGLMGALFTIDGTVRPKLVSDAYWKGTGVFGTELSKGAFLFINILKVEKKYRGQGFGKFLLNQVLKSPKVVETCSSVFVLPAALTEEPEELREEQRQRADHLYRARGFRRVGRTSYMAYSLADDEHPAFKLAEASDIPSLEDDKKVYFAKYDAKEKTRRDGVPPFSQLEEERLWEMQQVRANPPPLFGPRKEHDALLRARFPLHGAILKGSKPSTIVALIGAKAAVDLKLLRERNREGTTPLHLAALKALPEVVRALLKASYKAEGDLNVRDVDGHRPIDLLLRRLEEARKPLYRAPTPATDEECETLYVLQQHMGLPLPPAPARGKPWLALRDTLDSCSCGRCVKGLSPRMLGQIIGAADIGADVLEDAASYIKQSKQTRVDDLPYFEYLPPLSDTHVRKDFVLGFAGYLTAIGALVKAGKDVNPLSVEAEVSQGTGWNYSSASSFRHKGGSAGVALNALLGIAEDESRDKAMMDDFSDDEGATEVDAPVCEQDEDFAGLRRRWQIPAHLNGAISGFADYEDEEDSGSDSDF